MDVVTPELKKAGNVLVEMDIEKDENDKMNTVNKRLVFIIGGPYGFSPKVYEAVSYTHLLRACVSSRKWQ